MAGFISYRESPGKASIEDIQAFTPGTRQWLAQGKRDCDDGQKLGNEEIFYHKRRKSPVNSKKWAGGMGNPLTGFLRCREMGKNIYSIIVKFQVMFS